MNIRILHAPLFFYFKHFPFYSIKVLAKALRSALYAMVLPGLFALSKEARKHGDRSYEVPVPLTRRTRKKANGPSKRTP
ncbi:hypothetical protein AAEO50_02575 [Rossellomorea oryzaecorticis]|uniref:Uncharacterized protein n=1 Tax=Rossellomorea oryzaecorticis TaxID=1396505 RepID=A0ABU9K5U2_9BACI